MNNRGVPSLLAFYFGVLAALGGGAVFAYSKFAVASERIEQSRSRERTLLDERIASMRSIKEALNRPMPKPEPLAPITAKVANPHHKVAVAEKAQHKAKALKQAREAFARFDPPSEASSVLGFDRHSMRGF